jgi:GNAT superfamily N-acetyltransferase
MITIKQADLNDAAQAAAIIDLLNRYAQHPMGGGEALPQYTQANLIDALKQRRECRILLAYDGATPIGLCNCFEGFSTFACKPLLNIHDLYVADGYRNLGIAKKLLAGAEEIARESGCCKLTLEVLSGNQAAKMSYAGVGFKPYQLNEEFGHAEFWQKYL